MHLFSISRFKTSWEYADVARAGWQWSYDYSASMVRTLGHVTRGQGVTRDTAGVRGGRVQRDQVRPPRHLHPPRHGGELQLRHRLRWQPLPPLLPRGGRTSNNLYKYFLQIFSTNIFAVLVQVPGDCSCTRISVSSEGEAAATQSDKMGLYYLYGYHDGKVTNISPG